MRLKSNKSQSDFQSSSARDTNIINFPKQRIKLSQDLPPIHPEFLLNRPSILEADRKQRLSSYQTREVLYDVSHILDSNNLKVSPKPSDRSIDYLSKTFSEVKLLPTGRMEVEQLSSWLSKMRETHLPELETVMKKGLVPKSELTQKTEEIFRVALKELVKQVSVQSKLRGELIESIFETLKYIWNKYPEHLVFVLKKEREVHNKRLEDSKNQLESKVKKYKNLFVKLEEKCKKTEDDKENLAKEVTVLRKQVLEYRNELNQLMETRFKEVQDTSAQTDPETFEAEKVFLTRSLSRTNSIKDIAPRIQFNLHKVACDEETGETEDKSPINLEKERFLIEFQKMLDRIDLNPDIDIANLVETVFEQVKSVPDWLAGFRIAQNLILTNPVTSTRNQQFTSRLSLPLEIISGPHEIQQPLQAKKLKPGMNDAESQSAEHILKHLLIKTQPKLQKYAKNTKKKIIKHVNHSIYFAIGKKFSKDFSLADLVLQDLTNRYNVKMIAERKFKELIVGSILNMSESLRIKLFSCALGCGSYSGFQNFSVVGTEFCLRLYENMISSKTGVIFDTGDPLDIDFYPVSRALEVVKSVFSRIYPLEKLSNLSSSIKKLAEVDLNHVNKDGVIRLDSFIEVCMKSFEEFEDSVVSGCKVAVEAITDFNYLTRGEVVVLVRHLAPRKLHVVKDMNFDSNDEINVEDFQESCLMSGALSIETVSKFFQNLEKDWKVVLQQVSEKEDFLQKHFEVEDGFSAEELAMKVSDLNFSIRGKRKEKFLYLWHLLKAEIDFLQKHAN